MARMTRIGLGVILLGLFASGCSSTKIVASWKNPEYTGNLGKVYIVGIAKQETSRRIFEDGFARQLESYGLTGIPSYKDLPSAETADKEVVAARARDNGADALLLTRMTGKRTETVVTPGRVTTYRTRPYFGYRPYHPDDYYHYYGSYYDRIYDMVYEPATVSQMQIVILESNLYDTRSNELIWSAQLETIVEGDIRKMVNDFIKEVTRNLQEQGLL